MFPDGFELKPLLIFSAFVSMISVGLFLSIETRIVSLAVIFYWLYDFVKTYENTMREIRRKYKGI